MGRLDGKVAVITGATSGIGLRTAEVFVAEGAKVVIAGRRIPEGEALARQLGASCVFRQTDVTQEDQMRALIALAVDRFGRIDCLFNNAGGPAQTGGIEGLEVDRFDAAMATLVRSVMLGMKHAAPLIARSGGGSIVNIASAQALLPTGSSCSYTASKGGVVAFTKTIAFELAGHGIRANVVCPGTTDTPMVRALLEKSPDAVNRNLGAVPMGRLAKAEEIADMIVFLTGPASAFVTGTSIPVDGGRTRH